MEAARRSSALAGPRNQSAPKKAALKPGSARWGWALFGICLLIVVVFLGGDTLFRHISQADVTSVQTEDPRAAQLPVSPGATVRSKILPPSSMDGRWWVIHAAEVVKGNTFRVRYTKLDNAPEGREVHWSSGLVWLLALLAHVISVVSGRPALDCLPEAAFWAGPAMLVFSLCLLGFLAFRRFGPALAGILVLIFTTSTLIYQGFRAGEADHHGLVCAFASACLLCLVSGGGGLVRKSGRPSFLTGADFLPPRPAAKRWMIASGIFGGAALWVSAASIIPILAGCGIGALAVGFVRPGEECDLDPLLWRKWGVAGCLSSLFFYLLEYFPNHMGWRLEVNHPLYALAWLGAGDLLCRCLRLVNEKATREVLISNLTGAVPSALAVLAPVILILSSPPLFFWVSDRFVLMLHNECIQEFKSFPRYLSENGKFAPILEMFMWPVFVVVGALYLRARGMLSRGWQALLVLALFPALVMQVLAFLQIRWSVLSMGLWAICALVLFAAFVNRRLEASSKVFVGCSAVWLVVATLTFPALCLVSLTQVNLLKNNLPKLVIPAVLLRDVAHRLVQSSPDELPVVLSGPGSSTELNYYAGVKTIGTFYWENRDGLKKAARMFAASTEEEAKQRLVDAKVTHLVAATWDDFAQPYVDILQKSGEIPPVKGSSYIQKLLGGAEPPDWLRPLYYPIPKGFGIEGQEILIFRILPQQSHKDALLNRGIYYFDKGDYPQAHTLFEQVLKLEPANRTAQELSHKTSAEQKN